jgi:hypothetical protein
MRHLFHLAMIDAQIRALDLYTITHGGLNKMVQMAQLFCVFWKDLQKSDEMYL